MSPFHRSLLHHHDRVPLDERHTNPRRRPAADDRPAPVASTGRFDLAPAFSTVVLALLIALPARAAAVDIVVTGVRTDAGRVRVALCRRNEFPGFACSYVGSAAAKTGAVVVRIADVAPGVYAAEAFDDTNDSGKIETSFFGLPLKAMGFSRGAWMRFGPPAFAEAALTFGDTDAQLEIGLHYPG